MTEVLMVPTMFPEDARSQLPENLNPEQAKRHLDRLLLRGYRIKIMNDFVYNQTVFTHYVLEKEKVEDEEH